MNDKQREVMKAIRAFYRPLLRCRFRVEPFVILRSDGWSGAYNVIVTRDAVTILMVTVKRKREQEGPYFCNTCGIASDVEYCAHCGKDL